MVATESHPRRLTRAADLHRTIRHPQSIGMDPRRVRDFRVMIGEMETDIMRPDAAIRTAPVRFAAMTLPIAGLLLMSVQPSAAQDARNAAANAGNACGGDNGGITLSPGFCATVFADNVGHARHMVVAPNGVVYVNTWSGRYYANTENAKAPAGGFLLALQDTTGSGRADKVVRFGPESRERQCRGHGNRAL